MNLTDIKKELARLDLLLSFLNHKHPHYLTTKQQIGELLEQKLLIEAKNYSENI